MLKVITTILLATSLVTLHSWVAKADSQNGSPGRSDLVWGTKFPNSAKEGTEPVITSVMAPMSLKKLGGFDELVPYVLPSPNQEDAGSCLYMSLTGIAEWWMARLNPDMSRTPGGPLDLSERYMMNMAGSKKATVLVKNWKTDSILIYNSTGQSVHNDSYRFTKGWYKKGENNDNYIQGEENGVKSKYGTPYNWIREIDKIIATNDNLIQIQLPTFRRRVLFADPESNQWGVGVAPASLVNTIKKSLKEKKSPVQVIYNHFGYWHSVNIIGFNDNMSSQDCPFVEGMREYMGEQPDKLRAKATAAKSSKEKKRLLRLAKKWEKTSQKLEDSYAAQGGCHPTGMFYVRDSLYEDPAGLIYDFDPNQVGEEAFYTKPIVFHEYDWVRYLVNHAVQIYVE